MNTAIPNDPRPRPARNRHQFSLRRLFVAQTAVAAVIALAAWGGWLKSDAVVYLSLTVLAAVFSATARRALFGFCIILGSFSLASFLAEIAFEPCGRGPGPRLFWFFSSFLFGSAIILRRWTKATAGSLIASLLLAEIFTAVVIVYIYGYPTLFQAFAREHRKAVFAFLSGQFPGIEQGLIIPPWLAGILVGEFLVRRRKGRLSPENPEP